MLIALVGFCLYTEPGTKAALEIINGYTHYQIKYQTLSGTLATSLKFEGFQLESDEYTLNAQEINLSWEWIDWRNRTLHISYLDVQEMDFYIKKDRRTNNFTENLQTIKSPEDLETLIGTHFNVPVSVAHVSLSNSRIHAQGFIHDIEKLVLNNLQKGNHLFESLIYKGSLGSVEITLNEEIKLSWNLSIPSNWNIPSLVHEGFNTHGYLSFDWSDIRKKTNILQAKITASKIIFDEYIFEKIDASIQGTLQSHVFKLTGRQIHDFEIQIDGESTNQKWIGCINRLLIKDPKYKTFQDAKGKIEIHYTPTINIVIDLDSSKQSVKSEFYLQRKPPFALEGLIQAEVNELKSMESFLPIPEQATGNVTFKINIGGSLFKPQWDGTATLDKMKFATQQYGSRVILDNVTFSKFKNKSIIRIDGIGYVNNNAFSIDGSFSLKNFTPELVVNIEGEHLIVSQTPEYYISASPKLTFTLKDNIPSLSGKIFIPEAHIAPKNTKKASLSSDIVIINARDDTQKLDSNVHPLNTDITIILGSNVKYKGDELSSGFTGQLRLVQKPYKSPRLHGELNLIDGSYQFQGKKFLLTRGKLIYAGSTLNNPLMDIEAKQKVFPFSTPKKTDSMSPLELGVKLTGQFSDPKISFFSTPALSEADIMSYLILGRPQSEVTQAQDVLLLQALSQLSTIFGYKGDFSFDLAKKLHLDHISLSKNKNSGHSSLEDTVLILGKQISSRLYLNYSLGLYDSTNNIALQYKFNKNLSIEAQTGTSNSSADLIFSLDS